MNNLMKMLIELITGNQFTNEFTQNDPEYAKWEISRCYLNSTYYVELFEYATISKFELNKIKVHSGFELATLVESFWTEDENIEDNESKAYLDFMKKLLKESIGS